jgi:antitoxin ParD1/3/4
MSQYVLAPEVISDLSDIWQHIAEDDPDAADRVVDAFSVIFAKLVMIPGMGHIRSDLADETLRLWPVYSYLIVYRSQTDPLEIVRVLSGYRDIAALLIGH